MGIGIAFSLAMRMNFIDCNRRHEPLKIVMRKSSSFGRILSGKSRGDAMFIERSRPPTREPIHGRKVFGCAPKGASRHQFGLVFYKHFAATRFFRQTGERAG